MHLRDGKKISSHKKDSALPFKNHILRALSPEELARLTPKLTKIKMRHGDVLYEVEGKLDFVYFPENSIVSVVGWTEDGRGAEVALIGREGMAGIRAVLGEFRTPYQHVVQLADGGWKLTVEDLLAEFALGGTLRNEILRFISKLMTQVSQTALCNRLHPIEKRLSRWLLMCRDRTERKTLHLTQEFIANMLGANRTTVAITAAELQNAGLIGYSRGNLTVRDPDALEAYSCECYRVIKEVYEEK